MVLNSSLYYILVFTVIRTDFQNHCKTVVNIKVKIFRCNITGQTFEYWYKKKLSFSSIVK